MDAKLTKVAERRAPADCGGAVDRDYHVVVDGRELVLRRQYDCGAVLLDAGGQVIIADKLTIRLVQALTVAGAAPGRRAEATTDHAASSHGIPVVLVDGQLTDF
jgi:hypothetical protein